MSIWIAGPAARCWPGGQSLIPLLKTRLASPAALVDINGISELSYITTGEGES
ncbi:FAD binding domain-containing protein [Thermogymnomonas acidicola]|uniref:FAD binding domain-containing protein n=1 Tax=Thermogymnomonas acidicola TaxID=399579 RepID=UPI001493FF12|nr:FAD binding domain-containing protein [Thermogymnomonas acidicola]